MKLLIISAAFPPIKSGGADYAMRLADHMADRGVEVHVLTSTGTVKTSTKVSVRPLIHNWSWRDAFTIQQVVRELQPDVVDVQFTGWVYNDHPMITFAPSIIKSAYSQAHVSVHIESLGGVRRELSTPVDAAIRWALSQSVGRDRINYEYGNLLRDSDSLIFLNQRDLHTLTRIVPDVPNKSLLAPPPPIMPVVAPLDDKETDAVRAKFAMNGRKIVLAYFGYVYPGKGLETLLSAVKMAVRQGHDVGLLLAGGLPEQKVLQRAGHANYLDELKDAAAGIADRLSWIGYSEPDSDVPSKILRACDICVLPFDRGVMLNNSSFSFAAMHAIPIITTRSDETESAFVHDENAVLVPPQDSDSLKDAIIELSSDAPRRQSLGRGALSLAREKFNWDKSIDATLHLWQSRSHRHGLVNGLK